jgi:hypothetical protein
MPLLSPDVDLIDHSGQAVEHNHQIVKAVPTNNQIQADSDEPLVQDRTAVISRPKQVSPWSHNEIYVSSIAHEMLFFLGYGGNPGFGSFWLLSLPGGFAVVFFYGGQ